LFRVAIRVVLVFSLLECFIFLPREFIYWGFFGFIFCFEVFCLYLF
jgi:hypothetical protein